ncbi:MAG: type IV pilus modification protein PilV [Methylomonas sp.]|jgi:type IV pilus assembly protein PilV|nr:MAG: type IV pilus modification protein PilV [Methylomonas sp.]
MKNFRVKRQLGFSMIEVLVAVLVLAIGLLGVAAIQTVALKNNNSALQRSQATMLAYFMMDAMRANRSVAIIGSYDLAKTCVAPSVGSLITNDQNAWINALKSNLGNVSTTCGQITCAVNTCNVRVFWDDSRGLSGSAEQVVQITSRL